MRTALLALALCACATEVEQVDTQDAPLECARIEGSQLGQRVTVEIPSIDAVMPVTFVAWSPKLDSDGDYVGFTLDATADFVVKADFNFFYDTGAAWQNPFGASGRFAKAIEYVDVCDATREPSQPTRF